MALHLKDFRGGLNLRGAANELSPNESPDLWNVTLDELGGIVSRLGSSKYNGSVFGAAPPQALFYWPTGSTLITQCGAALYQGTSTTPIHTFTTTARVGMCEFEANLYVIHPVDGLFGWNGAAFTAIGAGPKGNTIATWQNKLWTAGDPAQVVRLSFCNAGDPTTWVDFVDIRDKDDTPIKCVAGGQGTDIVGRAGLLLFKNRSSYRVYDSTTGAYQTIDSTHGAASSLACTIVDNEAFVINESGVFVTDGIRPLKNVSEKLAPLFNPAEINMGQLDLFAAGSIGQRAFFSVPRAAATANGLMLEYHTVEGWFTANSNAASCYATSHASTEALYGGSPSVNGQVYQHLSGGTDDGTAIDCWFRTPWLEPGNGLKVRLRRLRINGRAGWTLTVNRDYEMSTGTGRTVTITSPTTGPSAFAKPDVFSLGVGRAFSLRLESTNSATYASADTVLHGGAVPALGAAALYELSLYPTAVSRT